MTAAVNSATLSDNARPSSPAKLSGGCKVTSRQDTPLEGVPGEVETRSRSFLPAESQEPFHLRGRLPPPAAVRLGSCSRAIRGKMPGMGNSLRAAALLAFVVLSVLVTLLISSVQQFGARISHFSTAPSGDDEELASLREALIHQLNERRKEIIPLLSPGVGDDDENGLLGESFSQRDSTLDYSLWNEITVGSRKAHLDEMGCDSLADMQAVEILGSGYTKLVVKVNLAGESEPVALKLVNEQGIDMGKCVEDFKDPRGCRELVSFKLRKEMVLLQRLQHPNVIKVKFPPPHCFEGLFFNQFKL